MACPEPAMVIGVLKSLTTATSLKDSEGGSCHSGLDQLLRNNLEAFDRQLEADPTLASFLACWNHDSEINTSPDATPRWKFVIYCLKNLHLLQKSLKNSSEKYKTKGHKPVTPNAAPVISPDTLGHNDILVVKTALQFIVCLGICPYLQRGMGIPLELRSGFSAMVNSSQEADQTTETEKCERLFMCVKVLVSCIFNPALGTTVLTQHFTDVLASLFQLIHTMRSITRSKQTKLETNVENVEPDSQNKDNIAYRDMTPASVVDFVRAQADTAKTCESRTSRESHNKAIDKVRENEGENSVSAEGCNKQELDKKEAEHGIGKTVPVLPMPCSASVPEVVGSDIGKTGTEVVGSETGTEVEGSEREKVTEVDLDYCERIMEDLVQKVYPPLLVKTLMMLQGGPRVKPGTSKAPALPPAPGWLRKLCGQRLTGVVVRPQGVLSVLRGMLDVPGATRGMTGAADWRKCDAVAKVIAHCPPGYSSTEAYYQKVAPQILSLLHIQDKQLGREFLRVACTTISYMATRGPHLAQIYIINPLLAPLVACLQDAELPEGKKEVVGEAKLNTCLDDCHKVLMCGVTANAGLISAIQPVILVLFKLYVFTKTGVSALRTTVQELLVTFLQESDLPVSLTCLQLMTFDLSQSELSRKFPRMHPGLTFAHGSSGGVRVVKATDQDGETTAEASVDCVVSLLKALEKSEVSGEFVVYMLNELTAFIQTETQGDTEACSSWTQSAGAQSTGSRSLFDLERENQSRADGFYRKLMLLNVLATVCEELGPACIRSARQTLHFVKATLERGVRVCQATEDVTIGAFESETLTMAMGLLTAVLTGAFKLTEADRKQMEELLPLLLEISENHPDSSVQEMAADIRVAIATHGAVWSEVSKSRGKDFAEMSQKIKKEQAKKDKPKQKDAEITRPKIEVIQTSDNVSDRTTEPDNNKTNPVSTTRGKPASNGKQRVPKDGICIANTCKTETSKNESLKNDTDSVKELRKNVEMVKDSNGDISESSEIGMAFKELCDPLIPVRGHGLIRLTKLVKTRDPSIIEKREAVLRIFEENLDHRDSYLYLSAVGGLAALCDMWPGWVLPRVCQQFSNVGGDTGDRRKRSVELRMKLGEIMVKATRGLGETVPQYRDLLLRAVLVGARDEEPLVRASSLSNLGDICRLLRFSLGGVVHEVFACCSQLLKSDRDVQVRKAAGQALVLLLQGLGQDVFKVLESVLSDLYRLLKQALATEPDDRVKVHVGMALEELDGIMRLQLFPQQKLEKKIRVLSVE